MTRRLFPLSLLLATSLFLLAPTGAQTPGADNPSARIIGEVFAAGRQLEYVGVLSDRIGSRLTGSAGARRAEEWAEGEMKRLGLSNVKREPYTLAASWERGPASASLLSESGARAGCPQAAPARPSGRGAAGMSSTEGLRGRGCESSKVSPSICSERRSGDSTSTTTWQRAREDFGRARALDRRARFS